MSTTRNTENCMVCGEKLDYLQTAVDVSCTYCAASFPAHIKCPKGHSVCDLCHGKEARAVIEGLALTATSPDPVEIAESMMALPQLPMLSCDHAFIAAGALMAALRNSPYGSKIGEAVVREAFSRTAKQAHGGYCGLTGVCGVAPAIGAVVSIFLGACCGSDREQKIVMEAVTRVSQAITDLTGPSCCKAYVRAALTVAVPMFSEKFGIVLPVKNSSVLCNHSEKHPHGCREEQCPYYRKPSKDLFAGSKFVPGTIACVT
ncbi:MAG: hypothetical protein H6Q96_1189 [Nitrospirae bacterium]|jgi:hypothetical protein|nr:hypothetical protein [Nitrospirota bacterium]